MTETHTLKADAAGFLIGGQPIKPSRSERAVLERLRDDVHAIRQWLEAKGSKPDSNKRAANDPARELGGSGARAAARPATPRLSTSGALGRTVAPRDVERPGPTSGAARPIVIKVALPLSRAKSTGADRQTMGRNMPLRDASGRYLAQPKIATPVLGKTGQSEAVPGGRDERGRFTKDGEADPTGGKMRTLLGEIRDKIGGPNLGGSEDVDPNIKAAQEIAGVAGGALNGLKAVGGVLGAVATPLGFMGRGKPGDAPTPWFRRFYNELRGLRREESVFNRAQLRTLKEIEAKPGQGKGGGLLGMLMMVLGPLLGAIGSVLTSGFGLLSKLPGMGLLAKMATSLLPGALMGKTPITQPTAGPDKKPGLLASAGKGLGGLLKRVPLLGAALAAVSIGSGVYDSETDDTATRAEKDKRTGKAIGGGGGAIAGMLSGGAAGAAIGALGGPIGIAIGGVVGAVAGGFFGEKAGDIVGEKVGGWVTDIRNADIPGMIGKAWTRTTDTMASTWKDTSKWFEDKWESALSLFGGTWDKAKGVFDDLSLGVAKLLGKLGIDLPAIKQQAADLAAAAAQKAKDVAGAVNTAVDYGKEKAWQAGEAVKNSAMGKGAGWLLDQFKGCKRKAAETAQAYSAGNIAGLDDAQTRALVASTVLTESGGGQLDIVNKQGYMGRYQAGASWLSSAGLMKGGDKAVREAMKADGFNSEWKWAESGGMTRYLSKDSNWVDGMSRSKYLASAGAQDAAFRTVNDKTYGDLVKRGVIKPGDSPEMVAGYLKTAHLAGAGGAVAVSKGGQGASDANGTSARKYFDDVAKDRHGFNEAFKNAGQAPVTATAPAIPAAPATTAVVTAGARAIPQMPSLAVEPPKVPDFQPVTAGLSKTMLGGEDKRPSVVVVGNKAPVGRDLSNRPLAHIVTGGLSGS